VGTGSEDNFVFGDAFLPESRRGGRNTIFSSADATATKNTLYGDAAYMSAKGGDDTLIGGAGSEYNCCSATRST
jgi:hypothetical protein